MPTYEVELTDGRVLEVDADREPTESELMSHLASAPSPAPAPAQEPFSWRNILSNPGGESDISGGVGGGVMTPMTGETAQDIALNRGDVAANRKIGGTLAAFVAPEALMTAVPGLSPAVASGIWSYLGKLGLIGAVGGAAGATTSEGVRLARGETTLPEAASEVGKQTLLSAVASPIIGLPLQKIAQGVAGAVGAESGQRFKGLLSGLARPLFSQGDKDIEMARQFIKEATGEEVPQSIGEALGKTTFGRSYIDVENSIKNPSGALTDEARNKVSRSVLWAAGQLAGSGATPEKIGDLAISALNKEIGKISDPAREAVKQFASQLDESLKLAISKAGGEAAALTTPAKETTPYMAGELKKQLVDQSQQTWRSRVREAFNAVRQSLGGKEATTQDGLPLASQAVKKLENTGLLEQKVTESIGVDAYGGPVAKTTTEIVPIKKTINDQVRGILDEIKRAGNTKQNLEVVRGYISDLNDNIDYSVAGGRGDQMLKEVVKALKQDLNNGINALPASTAKEDLKLANSLFSGEGQDFGVEEILNRSVVNAAKPYGEGGTAAESLYNSITGSTSVYNKFKTLLGDNFPQLQSQLRDAILTEAQSSARGVGGEFNIGKVLNSIDKNIPSEIKAELFPQLQKLRDVAVRELKASKLLGQLPKDPDEVLNFAKATPAEIKQYLTPGGEQAFADAIKLKAAETAMFENSVLASIRGMSTKAVKENSERFVNSIITKRFPSADVDEALKMISKADPELMQDLQVQMLQRLMDSSKVKGLLSGDALNQFLKPAVAGKSPQPAGEYYDAARAILGDKKVADIQKLASALGKTQAPIIGGEVQRTSRSIMSELSDEEANIDFWYIVARKTGLPSSIKWIRDAVALPSKLKYVVASKYLNDDALRPLLSKTPEELSGAEATQLLNLIRQAAFSDTNNQ